MPTGPWNWSDPRALDNREGGYEHWFTAEQGKRNDLLRPGFLELDLVGGAFDRERRPTTLADAVFYIAQILSNGSGATVLPFVATEDHLGASLSYLRERMAFRSSPVVRWNGLPLRAGLPIKSNPDPGRDAFSSRLGSIGRIVAVIDADIGFAHRRFRGANGSRIEWFWDMDATEYGTPLFPEHPPFFRGRFLYHAQIAGLLGRLDQPGYGEQHLYRDYLAESYSSKGPGLLLPSVYAHGTHVMDIARGASPGEDGTSLFAIQLPRPAVAQTHGYFLGGHLAMALLGVAAHALLIRSLQGGSRPEVQVNISVGGHAGRHDGSSFIEQFFEAMLRDYDPIGRIIDGIWLPAGNSYRTRTHARLATDATKAAPQSLTWRALPDDGSANFLELWLPHEAGNDPIRLTIKPPGRPAEILAFDALPEGSVRNLADAAGTVYARVYVEDISGWVLTRPEGPVRRRILIALRHTQQHRVAEGLYVGGSLETAGDWQIAIETQNIPDGRSIGTWITRDAEILRYGSGARQSFFPLGTDSDPVRTDGTISDLACGTGTCVVAAHLASDRSAAPYSSEGLDAVEGERAFHPTASAPAEISPTRMGLLAAGYFSGSSWRQGGTSVSTPLAMRHIVDLAGPIVLPDIRNELADAAESAEIAISQLPLNVGLRKRFGAGRLSVDPSLPGYPPRRRP